MSDRVIVVCGPTASGKTALSLSLAARFGGEVVSADSMQVYRGMDIGTAKIRPSETLGIPHHMLDCAGPEEAYSVARYCSEAAACCDDILSRGRIPVITGGTGLYIDSLLSGRDFSETEEDKSVREELSARYDSEGGEAMLEELRSVDPERAAILHPSDRRRIVRALEVYRLTGMTITRHDELTRAVPPRYDALRIITGFRNREALYARINERVDIMVREGLFDEVSALIRAGVPAGCTSMQAIGYKEAVLALEGKITEAEAIELIKMNSRRYAKRQLTWFNRSENAFRVYRDDYRDSEAFAEAAAAYAEAAGFAPVT